MIIDLIYFNYIATHHFKIINKKPWSQICLSSLFVEWYKWYLTWFHPFEEHNKFDLISDYLANKSCLFLPIVFGEHCTIRIVNVERVYVTWFFGLVGTTLMDHKAINYYCWAFNQDLFVELSAVKQFSKINTQQTQTGFDFHWDETCVVIGRLWFRIDQVFSRIEFFFVWISNKTCCQVPSKIKIS